MNETAMKIYKWLRDPFGKQSLTETHDPIIEEMKLTKNKAERALKLRTNLPIAAMVGDPHYKRRRVYGHTKHSVE